MCRDNGWSNFRHRTLVIFKGWFSRARLLTFLGASPQAVRLLCSPLPNFQPWTLDCKLPALFNGHSKAGGDRLAEEQRRVTCETMSWDLTKKLQKVGHPGGHWG